MPFFEGMAGSKTLNPLKPEALNPKPEALNREAWWGWYRSQLSGWAVGSCAATRVSVLRFQGIERLNALGFRVWLRKLLR